MNILKSGSEKLISLGTSDSNSTVDNGSIKLVNIISLITIFVLITTAFLEYSLSTPNFIYCVTCLFLFIIPLSLNSLKKTNISKPLLLLIFFVSIFTGTFLMNFGTEFRFTIIIPISLSFILFYNSNSKKLQLLLFLTIVYITSLLILLIYKNKQIPVRGIINLGLFFISISILIYSLLFFIKHIRKAEKQLKKKLKFEKTISEFSQLILTNHEINLNKGLKIILKASDVSRIYLFEKDKQSEITHQTHEACADGVQPEIDNPNLINLDLENDGFARWLRFFKEKKNIAGIVEKFPESEKEILKPQGIKSILVIPVFSGNKWNGFIGFDDVVNERQWDEPHTYLLSTIADIIGMYLKSIDDQNKIIQQNEELKKWNATKDKFFSIVSHDLRNPFNSLLGYSDLLNIELQENENETIKLYASMISKGLESSLDYLNKLLEWSLLHTKKINYTPTYFLFDQLINEIIEIIFVQTQKKDIKIRTSIQNDMALFADKNMIRTVVINLVSNAIKYSNKGDEIYITGNSMDNDVIITITDHGIGMSNKQCEQLFDIRGAVSTPGTDNESGTGLGLIICKEFVNLHNGCIAVESNIDHGSTFKITLPYSQN